jgi:hypothetical protein
MLAGIYLLGKARHKWDRIKPERRKGKRERYLKSTGKDEKRKEGLKKRKSFVKIQVFWKINAVSSGKHSTAWP